MVYYAALYILLYIVPPNGIEYREQLKNYVKRDGAAVGIQ
jgi:hypothetical protein